MNINKGNLEREKRVRRVLLYFGALSAIAWVLVWWICFDFSTTALSTEWKVYIPLMPFVLTMFIVMSADTRSGTKPYRYGEDE